MGNIQLSITIPTYNEERDLGACLQSLVNQEYPLSQFEVLIVDNYSTDSTLEIAKSFSKKLQIKILKNEIKDAEVSKRIGFSHARGNFFMYLDADMRFADKDFIRKMLFPFEADSRIAGNFVQFKVNKHHPPLTRVLSYDHFQRDPIFTFFTPSIHDLVIEKKELYWLCKCNKGKISPQGLMIYRKELILDYIKDKSQLIDNEIPAVLVELGHEYFAFVPSTGVEHLLLRSLKELAHKRIRNLRRTYFPNMHTRKFKWIDVKKDWPKVGIWMVYTHSFAPVFVSLFKALKYRDLCFLSEPALNMVSTHAIIYGVLSNRLG